MGQRRDPLAMIRDRLRAKVGLEVSRLSSHSPCLAAPSAGRLARESAEGLSIARRELPDLMIIDCYLPCERVLQTVRAACGDRAL